MDSKQHTKNSKFLSYVLRHHPDEIGVELDEAGWVEVDVLLAAIAAYRHPISRAELDEIVATSDKQRFALSDDGLRIRASQGHSVAIDLGYQPSEPPEFLFHGTVEKFVASIREHGLLKGSRHHVHLSPDEETARKVGSRRGKPVILTVQSAAMQAAGHAFFVTPNQVWLTAHVPPEFLDVKQAHKI